MQPDCGSPKRVRLVALEVAYHLSHRATITPRQASLLPQPWAFHRLPQDASQQGLSETLLIARALG